MLTRPEVIGEIHRRYLEAGADIVETNTFNSNAHLAGRLRHSRRWCASSTSRRRSSRGARRTRWPPAPDGRASSPARSGPPTAPPRCRRTSTTRASATSRFDELAATYAEATRALVEGGVDLILVETIFDTLNAKAALFAVRRVLDELGVDLPVMVSGTITDASGRTLSGPDGRGVLELRAPRAAGGDRPQLRARREAAAALRRGARRASPTPTSAPTRTPGLPNAFGEYDETACETADLRRASSPRAASSTSSAAAAAPRPSTSRTSRSAVAGLPPRRPPVLEPRCRLARPRAAQHRPGQPVRQRRRAHQRHRLGEVPPPDRGRRLRRRARRGAPAGGERRAGHRRQHGRGHARLRGRDGALPEPGRRRARHRARAGDDRLLEVDA